MTATSIASIKADIGRLPRSRVVKPTKYREAAGNFDRVASKLKTSWTRLPEEVKRDVLRLAYDMSDSLELKVTPRRLMLLPFGFCKIVWQRWVVRTYHSGDAMRLHRAQSNFIDTVMHLSEQDNLDLRERTSRAIEDAVAANHASGQFRSSQGDVREFLESL